jgi:hypothetical protein
MRKLPALLCCLLLLSGRARAATETVVLVGTIGSKAWAAAENRLAAELRAIGFELIVLGERTDSDHELARHAAAFGAIAAAQVMRSGDQGVIRVWLERAADYSGGYSHVSVNLRNPEVVSHAVLPVVELVFERSAQLGQLTRPDPSEAEGAKGTRLSTPSAPPKALARRRLGAPVWGPPVRYHVRSDRRHALRVGVGPWFSGADTTPAVHVTVGLRAHWFEYWSIEPELFIHGPVHHVDSGLGPGDLNFLGGRAHAMFEPWPKSNVSFGIGPGLGLVWVDPELPGPDPEASVVGVLSGRMAIASAVIPFVDVLFILTVGHAASGVASFAAERPSATLMRPAIDSMLAVDWHFD